MMKKRIFFDNVNGYYYSMSYLKNMYIQFPESDDYEPDDSEFYDWIEYMICQAKNHQDGFVECDVRTKAITILRKKEARRFRKIAIKEG